MGAPLPRAPCAGYGTPGPLKPSPVGPLSRAPWSWLVPLRQLQAPAPGPRLLGSSSDHVDRLPAQSPAGLRAAALRPAWRAERWPPKLRPPGTCKCDFAWKKGLCGWSSGSLGKTTRDLGQALHPMTGILRRERRGLKRRDTRVRPRGGGGGGWRDAWSPQRLEEPGRTFPLEPPGGLWPRGQLSLDFRPRNRERTNPRRFKPRSACREPARGPQLQDEDSSEARPHPQACVRAESTHTRAPSGSQHRHGRSSCVWLSSPHRTSTCGARAPCPWAVGPGGRGP